MKRLIIAFVTAASIASPALAKERKVSQQAAATQAYASADQGYRFVDSYTVIVNGEIVGRDPDPNVRLMLRRDPKDDAS